MKISIHLAGKTKKIGIYNLDALELEGIDNDNYDLEDPNDLERYIDEVDALVESGEFDILENTKILSVVDPEEIEEFLLSRDSEKEEELEFDTLTIRNLLADRFLDLIEKAKPGTIFYLRTEEGEGFWDFSTEVEEEEIDPSKISIGYIECALRFDTYDLLRESYYDRVCDTFLPTDLRYKEIPFEMDRLLFHPTLILGTLYKVITNPETGEKNLERLPLPNRTFLDESEEI